jgi:hypothetical protein
MVPPGKTRPVNIELSDAQRRELEAVARFLARLRMIDADMPLSRVEFLLQVALHPERSVTQHVEHSGISNWAAIRGADAWTPEGYKARRKEGYGCMVALEAPPAGAAPSDDLRSLRRKYVALNSAGKALVIQLLDLLKR